MASISSMSPMTPPGMARTPSSNGSDFIVLSRPPSSVNGQALVDEQFELQERAEFDLSLSSLSALTMDEAMDRIKDLLLENRSLKETIAGNNTAMREQYDLLSQWRQQMQTTSEETKQRYEQARNVVTNLRKANTESRQRIQELETEIESLKLLIPKEDSMGSNRSITEIEELKGQVEALHQTNKMLSQSKANSDKMVTDLSKEVETLRGRLEGFELNNLVEAAQMGNLMSGPYTDTEVPNQDDAPSDQAAAITEDVKQNAPSEDDILKKEKELKDSIESLKNENEKINKELMKLRQLYEKSLMEKKDLLALNTQLNGEISEYRSQSGNMLSMSSGNYIFVSPDGDEKTKKESAKAQTSLNSLEAVPKETQEPQRIAIATKQMEKQNNAMATSINANIKTLVHMESIDDAERIQSVEEMKSPNAEILVQLQQTRTQVSELTAALSDREKRIEQLHNELQSKASQLNRSQSEKDTTVSQLTQQYQTRETQLVQQLDSIQTELLQYKGSQPSTNQSTEDIQSLRSQVLSLVNELHEAESKLKAAGKAIETYKNRLQEAQGNLREKNQELEVLRNKDDQLIDSMRITITNLEAALNRERFEAQQSKQELHIQRQQTAECRNQYDQLCNDYHELLNTFEDFKASQEDHARELARQPVPNVRIYEEKIDILTAQLVSAEESLTAKENEIKILLGENQQMKADLETIPILQQQAEIYETDFRQERDARERLHGEKERFEQEVAQLQLRNQQLQDELNAYTNNQFEEMQRRHGQGYAKNVMGLRRQNPTVPQEYQYQVVDGKLPGGAQGGLPQPARERQDYQYPGHFEDFDQVPVPRTPQEDINEGIGNLQGPDRNLTARGNQPQPQGQLTCPKCNSAWPDVDTLQAHCIECLNL
ncbi:unnamed protein product [Owenia fusiformis]|uniref:Optineurin n=1 Tax=Owenia fusiformis TaxID=6347 RepID=A0A8S4NRW9_OWEFU|nr:unnamed protein product [Owenia fusiformis]